MLCTRCLREFEAQPDTHSDAPFGVCPNDGGALTDKPAIELLAARFVGQTNEDIGKVYGGRYVIHGCAGRGGMAKVYLAEDQTTGTPVAVKVLDTASGRSRDAHERFFREASAAAKIAHPSIVNIFDAGRHSDGSAYLVLEFLFGESLGDLLRRQGSLDPKHAVAVFDHAAAGLEAAHRAGIIHRDLKPDNIFMVGALGAPHAVKVLDFGLAKIVEGGPLTARGIAMGTVEYMAPEQVLTEAPDPRTDIYGLGVVMYRTFTGALPFDARDEAVLLAHHLLTPAPLPEARAPNLDRRICAMITKTLRKHPDNRYASMDALREDLERIGGSSEGEMIADGPLAREPDTYEPNPVFGRLAAGFFYKKLGRKAPDWGE